MFGIGKTENKFGSHLGWQFVRAAGPFVCRRKEFRLDLMAVKTRRGILTGILQKELAPRPK